MGDVGPAAGGAAGGPEVAPYGSWSSPITAKLVAGASVRFREVRTGPGGDVYWVEGRPDEGGRTVLVLRSADGTTTDLTPAPFDVRTRVHEYGGGAFAVDPSPGDRTTVVFVDFHDNRLYRQDVTPAGATDPVPLTPDDGPGARRFADPAIDVRRRRVVAVCEDHRGPAGEEPRNYLVAVDLDPPPGGPVEPLTVAEGRDFYSSPRVSPGGDALCFLAWDHPSMPWWGSTLYAAPLLPDGAAGESVVVAGGVDESVFQPEWGPLSGALYFASDRDTGWWNLYRSPSPLAQAVEGVERITAPVEAEFAVAEWNFGLRTYDFVTLAGVEEAVVCAFTRAGAWELATVDPETRALAPVEVTPYTDVTQVRGVTLGGRAHAVFVGGGARTPAAAVSVPLDSLGGGMEVLRSTGTLPPDVDACLSAPVALTFPTSDGTDAYAFFYPPHNPRYVAPEGERPPVLVKAHGGPTSAASTRLSLDFQYWTSRGIGVLDVNYSGGTGFGRAFRERLDGEWGTRDVGDCVDAVQHLVQRGEADPARLFVSGYSAGGYTTLRAITLYPGVFAAAASSYGIADLEEWARDTHKFEARYLDRLIGPLPASLASYRERSPVHSAGEATVPVAFFQGTDDRIVPPSQTEKMVGALRAAGVPVAYFLYEGEGHGFKKSENIVRTIEAELCLYGVAVLGAPLRF